MSLESEIRSLQIAIRDLIAVMTAQTGVHPPMQFNDNLEPVPLQKVDAPAFEVEERPVDYTQDIQKPALELVKQQGREALAAILARFDAKTARAVPHERWPELAAQIAQALS